MNDHVYTFVETVNDRKALVPSARHRVSGSKSKRCTLPSDNLTDAQKRKLNGPLKTYAINRPMPWEAFKSMPKDLQQAHLDYIQNRFELGAATISVGLFGLSSSTLGLYAKSRGLKLVPRRGTTTPIRLDDLRKWAGFGDFCDPEEPEAQEPETEVPEVEEPVVKTAEELEATGDLIRVYTVPQKEPVAEPATTNICAGNMAENTTYTAADPAVNPGEHVLREMTLKLDGDGAQIWATVAAFLADTRAEVEVTIRFKD